MDGHRHGLRRDPWIDLVRPVVVLVGPELVVVELVRQDKRGEVAPRVERADRIRVVGPAFVARDVTLDRPRLAAVERLVEPEQVVVALAVDEPFALGNEMLRIGRVDADVGFRMILDAHRRIAHVLGRVRPQFLTGRRRPATRRHSAVRVPLVRPEPVEIDDLRGVATHPLRRRGHICHALAGVASRKRGVRLAGWTARPCSGRCTKQHHHDE